MFLNIESNEWEARWGEVDTETLDKIVDYIVGLLGPADTLL